MHHRMEEQDWNDDTQRGVYALLLLYRVCLVIKWALLIVCALALGRMLYGEAFPWIG